MKRDKFKKMRLEVQTLEPVERPESCALYLGTVQMESPERMNFALTSIVQKRRSMEDGTLIVEVEATGLKADDEKTREKRIGKQAEILDYHFFCSRLRDGVITDAELELFSFYQKRDIPIVVKKLEFLFNNGKKIDFTDRVSAFYLNQLAS